MSETILLNMFIDGKYPSRLIYKGKSIKFFQVSNETLKKLQEAFGSSHDKYGLENIISTLIQKKELTIIITNNKLSFQKGGVHFHGTIIEVDNGYYFAQIYYS